MQTNQEGRGWLGAEMNIGHLEPGGQQKQLVGHDGVPSVWGSIQSAHLSDVSGLAETKPRILNKAIDVMKK